jgi:hypothetical protein
MTKLVVLLEKKLSKYLVFTEIDLFLEALIPN